MDYDDLGYHSEIWFGEWTKWFAWYPVRLWDANDRCNMGRIVWLETVTTRLTVTDLGRRWQYAPFGTKGLNGPK